MYLKINNVDRLEYVDKNSFEYQSNANDEMDTMNFNLKIPVDLLSSIKPNTRDTVEFYDGSRVVFGGLITTITETEESFLYINLNIECNDYSTLLSSFLVVDNFKNVSVTYIINNLIEDYAIQNQKVIDYLESGWSAGSDDTDNFVDGEKSIKISDTSITKAITVDLSVFTNNITSDNDDYIDYWFYVYDVNNLSSVKIRIGDSTLASYYENETTIFINGWNYKHILKSDFSITGTPEWGLIEKVKLSSTGTSDVSFDDIRLIGANEFERTGIESNTTKVESKSFNYMPLNQCIKEMADLIGFYWYVGYKKDLHFFSMGFELAPFQVLDDNGKMIKGSLSIEDDGTQLKNTVYVRGGVYLADVLSEEVTVGDGEQRSFKLNNKGKTISVYVDTGSGYIAKSVGIENLNDDDGTYDWFWNNQEKYISQADAGTTLTDTDKIKVTYYPYIPVIAKVQEYNSITEYGIQEVLILDKTIKTKNEALQRGVAEMNTYKNSLKSGSFVTYDYLKVGQQITINSNKRNINKDFIIWSINAKMRTATTLEYDVTIVNKKKLSLVNTLIQLLLDKNRIIPVDEREVLAKIKKHEENITINDEHNKEKGTGLSVYGIDANQTNYNFCEYA